MTQTTAALERIYLNALRNQVEKQADALDGLVTRDKQRALSQAQNLTNAAMNDVLRRYMEELNDEDNPRRDHSIEDEGEVRFDD